MYVLNECVSMERCICFFPEILSNNSDLLIPRDSLLEHVCVASVGNPLFCRIFFYVPPPSSPKLNWLLMLFPCRKARTPNSKKSCLKKKFCFPVLFLWKSRLASVPFKAYGVISWWSGCFYTTFSLQPVVDCTHY